MENTTKYGWNQTILVYTVNRTLFTMWVRADFYVNYSPQVYKVKI